MVEIALWDARIDVGDWTCAMTRTAVHSTRAPVTILARKRLDVWNIDWIWCAHCAPTDLDADCRDSEGIALAEGTLAAVLLDQQAWLTITRRTC